MVDREALDTKLAAYQARILRRVEEFDWFGRHISREFTTNLSSRFVSTGFKVGGPTDPTLRNINSLLPLLLEKHILLVGDSGSGKSTALWKLAAEAVNAPNSILPIFLKPRLDVIRNLKKSCSIAMELDDLQISNTLREIPVLILVDQFNEFGDLQPVMLQQLAAESAALSDKIHIIAASRRSLSSTEEAPFPAFTTVELRPLDGSQITKLLGVLLGDKDTARQFIRQVDDNFREICRNPMLLQMLAAIFARNRRLPENRSAIYEQFLNSFVHSERNNKAREIPTAAIERALRTIASDAEREREAHPIYRVDQSIFDRFLDLKSTLPSTLNYEVFREAILASPILRYDSEDATVKFIHVSIQEFYAARAQADGILSAPNTLLDVAERAAESAGGDLAIFLSGLLANSTTLADAFLRRGRLRIAARLISNARHVDSETVEEFVVLSLDAFKFSDEDQISGSDVVAYDLLRGLQLIGSRSWSVLPERLRQDCAFFVEKYTYSLRKSASADAILDDPADMLVSLRLNKDEVFRVEYLWKLAGSGAAEGLDVVRSLLNSTDAEERDAAVYAVGEMGEPSDALSLLDLVVPGAPKEIIVGACNALIRLKERSAWTDEQSGRIKDGLSTFLDSPSAESREAAAWALYRIFGASAAAAIVAHVNEDAPPYLAAMCIFLIGELNLSSALPRLVQLAETNPNAHVREDLARTLCLLFSQCNDSGLRHRILTTLLQYGRDEDGVVRMQIARGLKFLDLTDTAVDFLPKALTKDSKRYVAREALRQSAGDTKVVSLELHGRLTDLVGGALACATAISDIESLFESKKLDASEYVRERAAQKRASYRLLADLNDLVHASPQLSVLQPAVQTANLGQLDRSFDDLERLLQSLPWGRPVWAMIAHQKNDIITALANVALRIVTEGGQ